MIVVGINFFQCIFGVVLWLVGLGAGVRRTSSIMLLFMFGFSSSRAGNFSSSHVIAAPSISNDSDFVCC